MINGQKRKLEGIGIQMKEEARQQYVKWQSEWFGRLARYSLDAENGEQYAVKKKCGKQLKKHRILI